MFKRRTVIAYLFMLTLMIFTACGGNGTPAVTPAPPPHAVQTPAPPVPEEPAPAARPRPDTDREGYAITLPEEINTIMTIAPANTEIVAALGLVSRIIATDIHSANVPGIPPDLPMLLDMMNIDAEFVINLMPDILFVSSNSRGSIDPIEAAGITVIYMPTSVSIEAIKEDIRFIAAVLNAETAGDEIISDMQAEIDAIVQAVSGITEPRTVYFEVSPQWTLGSGTFLNEMIELAGAVNIFADQSGWAQVSSEAVITANPDVILTSTDFLEDPIADITERPGFYVITAVQNNAVFKIDTDASNRPTHNIVIAMRQIAEAVFPEHFQ